MESFAVLLHQQVILAIFKGQNSCACRTVRRTHGEYFCYTTEKPFNRRELQMLYIYPEDRNSLRGDCTLDLVKQLNSKNELITDDIIKYATGICGRYHYSSSSDVSELVSAYNKLISGLSKVPKESFNSRQWASLVVSLSGDQLVPIDVFTDLIEVTDSTLGYRLSVAKPPSDSETVIQELICSHNRRKLMEYGIYNNVLELIWSKEYIDSCVKALSSCVSDSQLGSISNETVKMTLDVVEVHSSIRQMDPDVLGRLLPTCLVTMHRFLVRKEIETEQKSLVDDLKDLYSKLLLFVMPGDLKAELANALMKYLVMTVETLYNSVELVIAIEVFLKSLHWLPSQSLSAMFLWQSNSKLLALIDDINEEEKTVDPIEVTEDPKDEQPEVAVALASPEDDKDLHSPKNWVDHLLASVPMDLDRKAEANRVREQFTRKVRLLVCPMIRTLGSSSLRINAEICPVILDVFRKLSVYPVARVDSELDDAVSSIVFGKEVYAFLKSIIEIELSRSSPFVHDTCRYVLMSAGKMRETLAALILKFYLDRLKSDAERTELTLQEWSLCVYARNFMSEQEICSLVSTHLKTYFQPRTQEESLQDPENGDIDSLSIVAVGLLHVLYVGGEYLFHIIPKIHEFDMRLTIKGRKRTYVPSIDELDCDIGLITYAVLNHAVRFSFTEERNRDNVVQGSTEDSWRHFTPLLFPVMTPEILNCTDNIVCLIYRCYLINALTVTADQTLAKAILKASPVLAADLDRLTSLETTSADIAQLLDCCKRDMEIGKKCGVAVLTVISIALDLRKIPLTNELIESYRNFVKAFDLYETQVASVSWGSSIGVDRLHCIMRIYRNSLICNTPYFKAHISDVLDRTAIGYIRDETVKHTESTVHLLSLFSLYYPPEHPFKLVMAKFNEYIFTKTSTMDAVDIVDGVYKWSVEVSSMARTSKTESDNAHSILDKLGPQKSFRVNLLYVLDFLVAGANCTLPLQEHQSKANTTSLFCANTLEAFLCSTAFDGIEWDESVFSTISKLLKDCGSNSRDESDEAEDRILSVVAVRCFSNVMQQEPSSNVKDSLCNIFAENFSLFHKWISYSNCPVALVAEFAQIITILRSKELITPELLSSQLSLSVPFILSENSVSQLNAYFPLEIQKSDRFDKLLFNFRGQQKVTKRSGIYDPKPLSENRLIFSEAIQLICQYGDFSTLSAIFDLVPSSLKVNLEFTERELLIVNSEWKLQEGDERLVFHLMVLNGILSLIREVAELPWAENKFFTSDVDALKSAVTRTKGVPTAPAIPRRGNEISGSKQVSSEARLCTYATTGRDFTQQHWYNCYTCKMVETVGMCSVCAINCHRGHDISYSKYGSFFCDCGAKGCSSMRSVAHHCSAYDAARGKVMHDDSAADISDIEVTKHIYEFLPEQIQWADFEKCMEKLCVLFSDLKEDLTKVLNACVAAHNNIWNVEKKQEESIQTLAKLDASKICYSKAIMSELPDDDGVLNLRTLAQRRTTEANMERERGRECSGIVSLENGSHLWLLLDAINLYIHHLPASFTSTSSSYGRLDTEALSFNARRINCSGDKVVVVGRSDVQVFRFGRDGEIIDRMNIQISSELQTHTNPITKAVWAPGRAAVLAVATTQFVRIFDLTKDSRVHLEEVVLPVGNVEDLQLLNENGEIVIVVLSSANQLYRHKVTTTIPPSNSYYMTNNMPMPSFGATENVISFYYSVTTNLLLTSFERGVWATYVPNGGIMDDNLALDWKKLKIDQALYGWQESSGIISALPFNQMQALFYMYAGPNELIVEKHELTRKAPFSQTLFTPQSCDNVISIVTFYEQPTVMLLGLNWDSRSDLWIPGLPVELSINQPLQVCEASDDLPKENLVLCMERCEKIERIEGQCEDLKRFYEESDLFGRLVVMDKMPVTVLQIEKFRVKMQPLDQNLIVRCIRIQVPADKGPEMVEFAGQRYSLVTKEARIFDIVLTRTDSTMLETGRICLDFTGNREGPTSIMSISLHGVPLREFGTPRYQVQKRNPLTLTNGFLYNIISTLGYQKDFAASEENQTWIINSSAKLLSLVSSHHEVVRAASRLLREVSSMGKAGYYQIKDTIFFSDLRKLIEEDRPIPQSIMPYILQQFKYMMCTRVVIFKELLSTGLGDSSSLVDYLFKQLTRCHSDPLPLLEVFVALTFVLLSTKDEHSEHITKVFLNVFTDSSTYHLSNKLRLLAQTQIFSYFLTARGDRSMMNSSSNTLHFMQWGGLRPFFQKTKIIAAESKEALDKLEQLMGPFITSKDLKEMGGIFDAEGEFLTTLLYAMLEKIKNEGHKHSMPKTGHYVGRHTILPAQELMLFEIVLMAQLNPEPLHPVINHLIDMIEWNQPTINRTEKSYTQLLLVRLLSLLISKCVDHSDLRKRKGKAQRERKAGSAGSTSDGGVAVEVQVQAEGDDNVIAVAEPVQHEQPPPEPEIKPAKTRTTENMLIEVVNKLIEKDALTYCYHLLNALQSYWRSLASTGKHSVTMKLWPPDNSAVSVGEELLGLHGKQGSVDSCEHFYSTVTEFCLRMPYQMKRIKPDLPLSEQWENLLCEFVVPKSQNDNANNCRLSKKLLVAMSNGDKKMYRMKKDRFSLNNNIELLRRKYTFCKGVFTHQQLTEMVEIVSNLAKTATEHRDMWRQICEEQLDWLLVIACKVDDPVSGNIVELIVAAIREEPADQESAVGLADKLIGDECNFQMLMTLLMRYLIGRDESRRWLMHGMVRSTIQLASRKNQVSLINAMWNDLWRFSKGMGAHGAQLADILAAYTPRYLSLAERQAICQRELTEVRMLSDRIVREGHDGTYRQVMGLGLGWKFMLMVTSPCLNCFNRQENLDVVKLNSIKQDTRFSGTTMMVKLAGHYEISKVIVKLSDVKKTKMVRKVNLHHYPKAIESPVELKTRREDWNKAGSATSQTGEGEITISLAIPICTQSLIIDFAELTETRNNNDLHCPRCQSVVQPNPGICDNCGENAFQCVKCRSINYDDKDPFLCSSCGYCKYARVDVSVLCRSLPGVQRITTDAERTTAVEHMSRLLSEMEFVRSQLHNGRNLCEAMWMEHRPLPPFEYHSESNTTNEYLPASLPTISPSQHSVHALLVALNYCKTAHEELCSQTMQLLTFREELRRYDQSTDTGAPGSNVLHKAIKMGFYSTSNHCFGCICARIMHSFVILQGLAADESCRQIILENKIQYQNLVALGLQYQPLVKDTEAFIFQMAYDDDLGTKRLCELVEEAIVSPNILSKSILEYHDDKWQTKLKSLIKHCIYSTDEQVHLSCLQTVQRLMEDGRVVRNRIFKKIHGLLAEYRNAATPDEATRARRIPVTNSVFGDTSLFGDWLLDKQKLWSEANGKQEFVYDPANDSTRIVKEAESWLWRSLFSPWISVRAAACQLMTNLASQPGHAGIAVSLLVNGLFVADQHPSPMTEHFFRSVHDILSRSSHIKVRLFSKGIHMWLMTQIYKECKRMNEEECKEISMDHHYGTLLRRYVETVNLMFSGEGVEPTLLKGAADHILLPLLQATIFLKRVVLRRTRGVDASRIALERLVRRVSSKEPLILLQAAVQSLDSSLDFYTQAQIVSVILEVVDPEKQKDEEFSVQIEKDPAQEDYLQGRMTGNPYKSSDPGIGPLMRDIKNKICTETEMVGLLDDDNGMELLIAGQIISLSLPVHDVYNKLWRQNHQGPMTIIYRMRGLSGDAVEPMVNTLGENEAENSSEDASLNKLVEAFSRYGGLTRVLDIIAKCDLSTGGRLLLNHMKLLMERCVKSEQGRKKLVEAGAISVFVKVVRECVTAFSSDEGVLTIGLDYLTMMGTIIDDIETHPYLHHLTKEDAKWLLSLAMRPTPAAVIKRIDGRVISTAASKTGSLILGKEESENVLVEACSSSLDWNEIDSTTDVNLRNRRIHDAERLAEVVAGIHSSEQGKQLKQKILDSGVLAEACQYLGLIHPPLLSATESPEWKGFLLRPSLKLMMNFMTNMAKGHEASQLVLADRTLPVLHRLEQIASDDSIGTLAENVMEALKENQAVAVKIESVRQETKQKKKQMAMAMRSKQLAKMGMKMGKQGEVKVNHRKVANEPVLEEVSDPLASCCICREAIFTGSKPAGAYSFGYPIGDMPSTSITTVSAMVLVHLECHQSAIRRTGGGRQADEWSKAQLHNAGVKCNIMTPLALIGVDQDGFTSALARYQVDLDLIQRTPEVNRAMIFTDMCHCIDRFVTNGSFSDRSSGGGRESNAQYLVILHLLALCLPEGELPTNDPRWRIYSFLLTEQSLADWNVQRLDVLRAALDDACRSSGVRDWVVHRNLCLAWSFIDMYFRSVVMTAGDDRVDWMKTHLLEIIKRAPAFNTKYEAIGNHLGTFEEYAQYTDLPFDDFNDFFYEPLDEEQNDDEGLDEEQDDEDEQEDEEQDENDQ